MTSEPGHILDLDPLRACRSKKRYISEEEAKRIARRCWYDRNVWLRVYLCDSGCGGFHLTRRDAAPMMQPGWRLPKKSQREEAYERKARKRFRGRR